MKLGIVGMIQSRKSTAFLMTLTISSIALFTHHLDGTAFAAIIATIFSTFTASHAYQQANTTSDSTLPPKGQL